MKLHRPKRLQHEEQNWHKLNIVYIIRRTGTYKIIHNILDNINLRSDSINNLGKIHRQMANKSKTINRDEASQENRSKQETHTSRLPPFSSFFQLFVGMLNNSQVALNDCWNSPMTSRFPLAVDLSPSGRLLATSPPAPDHIPSRYQRQSSRRPEIFHCALSMDFICWKCRF